MSNGVWEFVKAHPYLFANLPILAAVILLPQLAPNRDYRRAAVFSGLACLPCSLAEITSGEYWRPVLLSRIPIGVEDMIFTYSFGAAAWMIAALWCLESCTVGIRTFRAAFLRLLPWAFTTVAAGMVVWLTGMPHLTAILISSSGLLLFLLIRRASLWRLAVAGLVFFTPLYMFIVNFQFAVWPNYLSYWNTGGPWGTLVLGIPRGEIAWAAVFGAVWPVVIASALDIRNSKIDPVRVSAQVRQER
jgi:hypothetical protein